MGNGEASAQKSFAFVQALRGLAALWVVLYHASEGRHIDVLKAQLPALVNLILFDAGHYGVAVFFALSGFVIAHSLRRVEPSPGFLGRFIVRRSIRLDPPYWLSIAFVVAMAAVSARVKGEGFVGPTAGNVAAHVAYLQVILGQPNINTVYWTLTYEVQFYLFLAAMLVVAAGAARYWRHAAAAVWLMMGLLTLPAIFAAEPILRGLFIDLWPAFFIGVLAYYAPNDRRALAALAVLAALMLWSPGSMDRTFAQISAATAAVLATTLHIGWIERGWNWRWLQGLGTVSYSLYLLHNPVTGAVGFVTHRLIGAGLAADLLALVAIVLASVVTAVVFWRIVEQPAHRLSRRVSMASRIRAVRPTVSAA